MIERDAALQVLEPHITAIYNCIDGGVREYFVTYTDEQQIAHTETTKKAIMRDHIVQKIRQKFASVEGVTLSDLDKNLFLLYVSSEEGGIAVWFKSLNERKLNSNNPSKRTKDIYNHDYQLSLGFKPSPTILIAGFQLNETKSELKNVLLVCRNSKQVIWYDDLVKDIASENVETRNKLIPNELPYKQRNKNTKQKDGTQG